MQSIIRSNEINNHESVKEFFYCLDKLAKDREGRVKKRKFFHASFCLWM